MILKVTEHQSEGVPPLKEVEPQIQERLYMTKMQPALREYLTKLREDAYIDIKPGYVDTGASPNETKPIYTTASTADDTKKAKKKKKFGYSNVVDRVTVRCIEGALACADNCSGSLLCFQVQAHWNFRRNPAALRYDKRSAIVSSPRPGIEVPR